jgi:hypothetical protein
LQAEKQYFFYAIIIIALVLTRLPFIGKFVRVVNTMIHESGHAIFALLTSGSIVKLDLFQDTSGAAKTQSKYYLGKVLVSLAGYVFASASAFFLFYLLKKEMYDFVLYILGGFAIINLIFWVRNSYGIFWLISFIAIIGGVIYYKNPTATFATAVLFSAISAIEALVSAGVILYISINASQQAGDAKNLKEYTYIPAVIWGLFFFAQASYFFLLTLNLYFGLPFRLY